MSNLPAIPSAQEFQTMKELGLMAIKSGFLPTSIKTPEQAVVIILKGRELGIPPMQAFSGINVIQGKPAVSPELMTALIYKNVPGAVINFVKTDNADCVVEAKRPGGVMNKFSFSIEDAKRAGLLDKGNWKTFPAAMLRARCLSAMARALFPDAIAGCSHTPEELGAEVDDEGNVLEITAPSSEPQTPPTPPPPAQAASMNRPATKTAPPQHQGSAGDHVIGGGVKNGQTIRKVVEDEGLAETQNYLNNLKAMCTRDKKPLFAWASFFEVELARYAKELAVERANQSQDEMPPPPDWINEGFPS